MGKPVFDCSNVTRCRFVAFGLLLALLVAAIPAPADVFNIDPGEPPQVTLPFNEAQRLQTLQNTAFPKLMSPLSPSGNWVLALFSDIGAAFINVTTGRKVPVDQQFNNLTRLTEFRWIDYHTIACIGLDNQTAYHWVELDRRGGQATSTPLDLPGYPLSLSNRADKVLLAREAEATGEPSKRGQQVGKPLPPIKRVPLPKRFSRPGPAKFDFEDRLTVPVATETIACAVYDLSTGELTPLIEVPVGTALMALSWSPQDHRLAVVRWKDTDSSRSGQITEDSPEVQDSLGNLPPEDNPYYTDNSLDLFYFRSKGVRHREIHPQIDSGVFFSGVDWDPTGLVFVARMWSPGTPQGRTYPTYTHPNGSKYRFYLSNGRMLDTLDQPQVEGLYGSAHMISPSEVLIHTALEMDFTVFHYNLVSRALTRLSIPPGSVYQIAVSCLQRAVVYNFSSYQQPYELYRLNLEQSEPTQITQCNSKARDLNQVRADQVRFRLVNGDERTGYMIQPADEAFPPVNVPVVVWQHGGPIAPMTQEWGGDVEMPFNLLPNFGIAVLAVPLPGRDGFGREFLDGLAGGTNFGQIDVDEQVQIVDQMVERGYTSRDQTGVTGCSYGGYFAAQSVTSQGDVYAAANPQCTLLDLTYEWEMGYTDLIAYLMGRSPDGQDEYYQDSPLSRAEQVKTPTLIFAGTEDFLPSAFSREFHDRISAVGTPVDYYEFIGEPHGLRQMTSQFVAGQAQLEWFRNYLLP